MHNIEQIKFWGTLMLFCCYLYQNALNCVFVVFYFFIIQSKEMLEDTVVLSIAYHFGDSKAS